jgi:hypothetical protein
VVLVALAAGAVVAFFTPFFAFFVVFAAGAGVFEASVAGAVCAKATPARARTAVRLVMVFMMFSPSILFLEALLRFRYERRKTTLTSA